MQQTKAEKINKGTIVNLIQHLPHTLLCKCKGNDKRGRSQIKFGMTPLYNKGAFTLIELLVVVLIIGILAAVALPQYQKAVWKSRLVGPVLFLHNATKALEMYLLENGWPSDSQEFEFLGPNANAQFDIDLTNGLSCEGTVCYDKYFMYRIRLDSTVALSEVNFCEGDKCDPDEMPGAQIQFRKSPGTSNLDKPCFNYTNVPFCQIIHSLD